MAKKRYDLFFSVGEACSCTQSLRDSKLQVFSYPFDWLFGANFEGRMKIVLDEFKRFIDKNDLEFSFYTPSIKCNAYHNTYNDITFNHDFLKSVEFDVMYAQVRAKYERRIKRLLSQIQTAKSLCIVYIETPARPDKLANNDILKTQWIKIKEKYPDKTIDFLYFTNDKNFKRGDFKEENITNSITKITGNYKLNDKWGGGLDYLVIPEFFTQYFKKYSLNLSFMDRLKQRLYDLNLKRKIKRLPIQILVNLVPKKSLRKKLRQKFLHKI